MKTKEFIKREKEQKYYLRKIQLKFYEDVEPYLNFSVDEKTFWLSNAQHSIEFKTQFTQKEIDEIKEKYGTDLSEFKQIPVEEIDACIE